MIRKTILLAALLGAGATPTQAQSHPPRPPVHEAPCLGKVVVETVRPKSTITNGFTYEVLLQNRTPGQTGYRVTVTFEGFATLAQQTGNTITIPSNTITLIVPGGTGSRSAETQFGTVRLNQQSIYFGSGVGARYDSGAITNGGPAAVRLTNCVPFSS